MWFQSLFFLPLNSLLFFFLLRPGGAGAGAGRAGGMRLLGIFKVYRVSANCTIDNFNKLLTSISAILTLCELIHILFLCTFCNMPKYLPETYLPTRSLFFHWTRCFVNN